MSTTIKNKRLLAGFSQSEVSESLGISRPTYIKIEQGLSKPTEEQLSILAELFDISDESLIENKTLKSNDVIEIKPKEIPPDNVKKFKQVLLYIISKVGSRPNIGQTALYKLLYFIDFDFYEKNQKYLMGATYIKNIHGPSPVSFAKISRELEKKGLLVEVNSKYFNYDQKKYLATRDPNVSELSAIELKHIDDELERLASKTAKELSELSHIDTPWKVAKDKQVLNYRHVFYRPDETSVSDE
jgi:transcriptional regulator with XRE-family HTH domain